MSPELPSENPYESPRAESRSRDEQSGARPRRRLAWLVLPTVLGALGGSLLLAESVRCPGDPFGHSIGAGLGGCAGLAVGIALRVLAASR